MANSKLKLLKILEILQETDEENPLTSTQILSKLKLYGIEAERKSICRDINLLRDDAGFDIILHEDKKLGYYMASREFEDWEIKLLTDAVWSSKFITRNNAKSLADKLQGLTSASSRKYLRKTGVIESSLKVEKPLTKMYIDTVFKAIKAEKKIEFQYAYTDVDLTTKLRHDGKAYVVSPYSLIWSNSLYYLIAYYDKYESLSYFRLDKMRNVKVLSEVSKNAKDVLGANADIKLEEFAKFSLNRYAGDKVRLTLEAIPYMVDDLIDYFGRNLDIKNVGDKCVVTVEVLDSHGLYYWLLSRADNVKVLAPESVKESLLKRLASIQDLYKND